MLASYLETEQKVQETRKTQDDDYENSWDVTKLPRFIQAIVVQAFTFLSMQVGGFPSSRLKKTQGSRLCA